MAKLKKTPHKYPVTTIDSLDKEIESIEKGLEKIKKQLITVSGGWKVPTGDVDYNSKIEIAKKQSKEWIEKLEDYLKKLNKQRGIGKK